MATMPNIVAAIVTATSGVTAIDKTSTDEYLPPITTANTALIIPAFGQQTRAGLTSFDVADFYETHRIRCELWVKHNGNNANLTQRARAVAKSFISAIYAAPTLGGAVDSIGWFDGNGFDYAIDAQIAEQMVNVGGVTFLPITIMVTVTDFSPS
jgi:hypothetical protein